MKILVVTSVFPNEKQPGLGVFVKERMFNVAKNCELRVFAPAPWFPFINLVKKDYRPIVPELETPSGIEVRHPRFFNIPRFFKFLDGFFFFLSSIHALRKLRKEYDFDLIDSHFVYPDGLGAVLLGMLFRRPVTVTVRGTIRKYLKNPLVRPQIRFCLNRAARVFTVCEDLKKAALEAGAKPEKVEVVANGINIEKFQPMDKDAAREALGIGKERKVIISVGGLVMRKGYHKVIEVLPELRKMFPDLLYIIVGGPSVEGNNEEFLRALVREKGLEEHVLFAGLQPHDQLHKWLSASDVFCLMTSNEGWANVFLEAMACGLPVVTTPVGGNREVVSSPDLGLIVDLEDSGELLRTLTTSLLRPWDRARIIEHAGKNTWDERCRVLLDRFAGITRASELN